MIFFSRYEIEKNTLTYRISEDRMWFYTSYNGKNIDDHLMKKNIRDGITVLENIRNRFKELDSLNKNSSSISIQTFDIRKSNPEMYSLLLKYSLEKEDYYNTRKSNNIFFD